MVRNIMTSLMGEYHSRGKTVEIRTECFSLCRLVGHFDVIVHVHVCIKSQLVPTYPRWMYSRVCAVVSTRTSHQIAVRLCADI